MHNDALDLGLSDAILGSSAVIPLRESRMGEGLTLQSAVGLEAMIQRDFEGAVFLHARLPELEEVGLSLHVAEADAQVLKISSVDGGRLEVLGPELGLTWFDSDDPGTVYLQMEGSSKGVVRETYRSGVLIDRDARQLAQLFLRLQQEPYAPIDSPVAQWLDSDPWLRERVRALVLRDDPLRHVVAVGLAKRLSDHSASARDIAARILAGQQVESLSRSHAWFRRLDGAQLRTVERLACDRAKNLATSLASSLASPRESVSLDSLRERDDLQGVFLLLRETGTGQRLAARLADADRLGIDCESRGMIALDAQDEQLRRSRMLDPLCWWTTGRVQES
jgi:hypothetical protein